MKLIKPITIAVFFVLFCSEAFCETIAKEEPIICNGDKIEYADGNKSLTGEGNVSLKYGNVKIDADKVEVNLQTKEAFASGNVIMRQGTNTFRADNVLYNFQNKKGKLINGVMSAPPWYGRCEEINKTGDKEYVLGTGYISTCDKFPPHYKIRTKQVKLYLGDRIEAKNVVICAGSVPILYLPSYTQDVKGKKPMITLVPGHSKEWGYYNLTGYRYRITEGQIGNLHLDFRSEKGVASGVTHNYNVNLFGDKLDLGKGLFDFYYMNEDDKSKPEGTQRQTQRYRAMLRHIWQIDEKTQMVGEYNKQTDVNFTKDYFYRQEYVNEIQPKTYIYGLRSEPGYSVGVLSQHRVNQFFTETEYQPEVNLDIKNQRVFDNLPVYYKGAYSAASLVKKNANSDIDDDAVRLDGYDELSTVFMPVRPVSLRPYIATRQTWYSKDKNGDEDLARGIFYSGIDASTRFYKTYNLETKIAGRQMHGLRHVLTPLVRYGYNHKPNISDNRLTAFDDIDSISGSNVLTFALENDFQTKIESEKTDKSELASRYDVYDLARFVLSTDYNFNRTPGGEFSNILADLELRPSSKLLVESDVSFNPHSQKVDIANLDLVARREDGAKLGIGHRYEKKESSEMTFDTYYPLTKKLGIHNYERYQFYDKDFKEQEYGISYDLHCWTMDLNFNKGVGGSAIWVIFKLKAFPNLPIQLGSTYESPKPEIAGN